MLGLVDGRAGRHRDASPLVRHRDAAADGELRPGVRAAALGGTDYHGDLGPYAQSHAELFLPTSVERAVLDAIDAGDGR